MKNNNEKLRGAVRLVLLAAVAGLFLYGIVSGGFRGVMAKAIRICAECVGIG